MKTNLAPSVASFVGRERDLAAIAERFEDGARLVTLLGPGGMGKTRTALRHVESQLAELTAPGRGGAWMCDLAPARSMAEAAAVIASALGVRLARDPADLTRALARRGRLLLVLDNFESILPEGAALATALLRAPGVSLLVTSRVALGVAGEHLWTLEPMASEAATRLFLDRAQQVSPELRPGPEELATIADIVQRVDGIPLAIELAAARASILSPAQIASRLSLPLLTRAGSDRHASMSATIRDSLALLDHGALECLVAATVFRGGFDLEAAEAVVGTIAQLEGLRARSLLRAQPDPERGGRMRFRLYEPIRELAAEMLTSREPRDRHLAYFSGLASPSTRDLDNLLVALDFAIEGRDAPRAFALLLAIDPLLRARGQASERVRLQGRVLTLGDAPAEVLVARGHALRQLGRIEEASRTLEAALAAARTPRATAMALVQRGELLEEATGATAEARACFEEALRLTESAEARMALAHAYRREGRLDDAEAELTRAITSFRERGEDEGLVRALFEAGVVALFREQHARAAAAFDETEALAKKLGDRPREGAIHAARGTLIQEMGRLDDAILEHEESCAIFREVDGGPSLASSLYYLAGALLERGQPADALAIATQALDLASSVSFPRYEALLQGLLAVLAFERGEEPRVLLERARASAARCATEPSLDAALAIHATHCGLATELPGTFACDDPRFAMRLLRTAGRRAKRPSLVVGASSLVLPDGTAVDLSRRAPLWRIVAALVERRLTTPGDALGIDDLIAIGWPGERVKRTAGVNRVHVAITELRKLGLRELIVSGERGYALTSAVAVVRD